MDLSIVIPVYNGEKTIRELFRRLQKELENNYTYEIIFVHDSGKDESWDVIIEMKKKYPGIVKGFSLLRNYGQHNAILYGISEAIGDFIITIDEDLQHDPFYIRELIEKQKEVDFDVVYARFTMLRHPDIRIRTSELLRGLLSRIVPGLFTGYSPYRLIKKGTAKKILFLRNSYTFLDGYLGQVTTNFGCIEAEHFSRADGESSYSYYKLFRHAIMIAIAYSPLKKWILTLSLILNLLAVVLYLIAGTGKLNSTIIFMCTLFGITGVILLFSGLIAEVIHHNGMKSNLIPEAKFKV